MSDLFPSSATDAAPITRRVIRDARPDDVPALAALKLATFRETFLEGFAIPYPPADLARFEAETYGLARVAAEIADPMHRSWVVEGSGADGEEELVAYAHVGPCKLPHPEVAEGDLELYQLYLRGRVQGTGLGKRLLDHALSFLERSGRPAWLGVWSGNGKARHVYEGRGFEIVGEYRFRVGEWLDDERIMRRSARRAV